VTSSSKASTERPLTAVPPGQLARPFERVRSVSSALDASPPRRRRRTTRPDDDLVAVTVTPDGHVEAACGTVERVAGSS
jgi:hypothetical protein